jgi:CxxC motif-containing protein (DUF1111 family)
MKKAYRLLPHQSVPKRRAHSPRCAWLAVLTISAALSAAFTDMGAADEAPTGFDNKTNGFEVQAAFDEDRKAFEEVETVAPEDVCKENKEGKYVKEKTEGGLGPVYNNTSCVGCHQNPVTGSSSQIAEIRAGHFGPDPYVDEKTKKLKRAGWIAFIEHPGGSLVHQRGVVHPVKKNVTAQEHVLAEDTNRTLRMSTNILGDGFVECIGDIALGETPKGQVTSQFGDMRGTVVIAPAANDVETSSPRVGRFGWKSQESSLLNFSANAYLNEMGITSPLQLEENTADGVPVPAFDQVKPEPEDKPEDDHIFGEDVEAFTRFMRSTKAPPRSDKATENAVKAGERLFRDLDKDGKPLPDGQRKTGCAICHVPDWTTLPKGSPIGGGFLGNAVPEALGNKTIHPFTDFLLHDIGTGDGIVQTQHAQFPPPSSLKQSVPDTLKNAPSLKEQMTKLNAFVQEEQKKRVEVKDVVPVIELLPAKEMITEDKEKHRRAFGGELVDTARMIRTAPLWGLRVRPQLLHDGSALTIEEAILRHSGQAERVKITFRDVLSAEEKAQLLAFLNSL